MPHTLSAAKVLVMLSVTALLVWGIDAQATGVKYEPSELKDAFQKADPYITQDDRHMLHFDSTEAKRQMNQRQIQIMDDFVALSNDYVEKIRGNPDQKHELDPELAEKFSGLKDGVQETKNEQNYSTDWMLPKAFAYSDVCGGSLFNPHPEYMKMPVHTEPDTYTAIRLVESLGYHQVEVYATDPRVTLNSSLLDYGKKTLEYGCNFGAFRDQIVLKHDGAHWIFRKQIKEPNPEILDYDSPVWWWTVYTAAWHAGLDQTIKKTWDADLS